MTNQSLPVDDPSTTREAAIHDRMQDSLRRLLRADPRAWIGGIAVAGIALLALVGPLLVTTDPEEYVARVYSGPSATLPLGADVLGRDVLSRLLVGGQLFLFEGITAAIFGVGIGVVVGMLLGTNRGRAVSVLRFATDTVMLIPQILLVLLIITAFGASPLTLIVAVAAAQILYTARVISAATQSVTSEDYYLAAQALGLSRGSLIFREVFPNIIGVVLVEFGVRLSVCFVALASLSYLGFSGSGAAWGSMIHENQGGIPLQPFAALAPVAAIGIFLLGMNMLRDSLARALARRTAQ